MKFAVAGIIVALAACVASSAVPLAWPYAGSYAHHVAAAPLAPLAPLAAPWASITQYSSVAYPHVYPQAYPYAAPAKYIAAPAVVAAPIAHALPAASYTAANRGSVHTAPLPGHAVSQTSLNLAPAPGTL